MAKYLERITKNYWSIKGRPDTWLCSYKRDGLFAHMERGTGLLSREGNRFPGFAHIEKEIQDLLKRNRHITHVQGELFSSIWPFQSLQGIIRGDQPHHHRDKAHIQFHIFNVGGFEDNAEMTKVISNVFGPNPPQYLFPVEFWPIADVAVPDHLAKAEALGWEGLVLRSNSNWASPKEEKTLFKVKGHKEMDLTIVGYEEGKGHIKGMLGKLICTGETAEGEFIEVNIGGGFKKTGTDDSRQMLWIRRHKLVGKTIEVRHEGVTLPNKWDICSLTKARFTKLKEDR